MAFPSNTVGQYVLAQGLQSTGDDFEFIRANVDSTVFASAVRSATVTSADLTNHNCTGAVFYLDVTAVPGSASATVAIVLQGKDPTSGKYSEMFRSTAFSAGTTVISVHPGLGAGLLSGTVRAALALPRIFRVLGAVSAGATSKDVTFSIGMSLIK